MNDFKKYKPLKTLDFCHMGYKVDIPFWVSPLFLREYFIKIINAKLRDKKDLVKNLGRELIITDDMFVNIVLRTVLYPPAGLVYNVNIVGNEIQVVAKNTNANSSVTYTLCKLSHKCLYDHKDILPKKLFVNTI